MEQQGIEFHFALARPPRSGFRKEPTLVSFLDEGLVLWRNDEKMMELSWRDVEKINYRHFRRSVSGMFQMLSGNLFGRREAVFLVQTAEGMHEFYLELDAEYRSADLVTLFTSLYQKGVPLHEILYNGLEAFLLEASGSASRQALIEGLKMKKGSDE